jgi:hypothetical protein
VSNLKAINAPGWQTKINKTGDMYINVRTMCAHITTVRMKKQEV